MNILIMGAPGSGKGTMSRLISENFGITHVSSGDLFRQNIKDDTPIGNQAREFIEQGLLVPDDITIEIVKERILEFDCEQGFLLDGFPRTSFQAHAFERIEKQINRPIDLVINLVVDRELLVKRITGRRMCPVCSSIYNIFLSPPKVKGVCDKDGRTLLQRPDDTLEALSVRLEQYDTHTQPMLEYYRERGIVKDIDGSGGVEPVWKQIKELMERLNAQE
ncbi:MAG: adenylate kinase [Erysipelothrix sp.]|nr:adenylate kinase [Erysipelothrix sp.]